MKITFNVTQEVYDYFSCYDMTQLVDNLLDIYDFTTLPEASPNKTKQVRCEVHNLTYIAMYNAVGPRSKKVSLARLLEFAFNMDICNNPDFTLLPIKDKHNPVKALITKAYNLLVEAAKQDNSTDLNYAMRHLLALKEVYDATIT